MRVRVKQQWAALQCMLLGTWMLLHAVNPVAPCLPPLPAAPSPPLAPPHSLGRLLQDVVGGRRRRPASCSSSIIRGEGARR